MSSLNRLWVTPFFVLLLVTLLLKVVQSSDNCTCVNINVCADEEVKINPRSGGSNGQCSTYLEVCCNDVRNHTIPLKSIPNDGKGCGYRNHHGIGFRTLEGHEAEYGEFPWMMAILKSKNIIGGGSLIHPKVVLTAAHVVHKENKNNLVIRAGEWDIETTAETYPSQDTSVSKIIIHDQFQDRDEKYNRQVLYNDVALIIVSKPFLLSNLVNTVCLPSQNFAIDSSRCFSGGWGKHRFDMGYYQNILKRIQLPIVQRGPCLDLLQETKLPIASLHKSFICAGGVIGKDTCTGDGGSPLVCPLGKEYERYQQAGIVAWGIKCGSKTPGVYVNVASFRDWIDDQMANTNLKTSYYTP